MEMIYYRILECLRFIYVYSFDQQLYHCININIRDIGLRSKILSSKIRRNGYV